MIIEFFKLLISPTSFYAKKHGYAYASIALEKRFERCKEAWSGHIQECHRFVLSHLNSKHKKIAILGSGPLYEIPINQLLETAEQIILIDLVHPKSVIEKYKKNPKIKFINQDITGFSAGKGWEFSAPDLKLNVDLTLSANILTQLPIEPIRMLKLKDEKDQIRLAQKMGEEHLGLLRKLPGKKILIADVERVYRDPSGREIERIPSRFKISKPDPQKTWTWNICPRGEESKEYSFEMTVHAYEV